MTTTTKSINSSDRFGWQNSLINDNEYYKFSNGLVLLMTRTGTGKSRVPLRSWKIDKQNQRSGSTILVPKIDKNLVKQYSDEFIKIIQEEGDIHTSIEKKSDIHHIISLYSKGDIVFTIEIKTLPYCSSNMSMKEFIGTIPDDHAVYIDEFHKVQTQFGLNHAGVRYNHDSKSIERFKNANKRNDGHHFRLLNELCKCRKVVIYSATLDDVICNDLLPYTGEFEMLNIIIRHQKDSIPNTPIEAATEEEMINKIWENLRNGKKTVAFCATQNKARDLENCLREKGVSVDNIYRYTANSEGMFDTNEVKKHLVCIFVNKGTTGMDIDDIELVCIFRELSDSGSSSREHKSLSNKAIQIIGRIRKEGRVYWTRTDRKEQYLFDVTETNFDAVKKSEKESNFFKEIKTHPYKSDFENHIIRLFVFKFILGFKDKKSSRENLLSELTNKFGEMCGYMRSILESDRSIEEYKDIYMGLEKNMVEFYINYYIQSKEVDIEELTKIPKINIEVEEGGVLSLLEKLELGEYYRLLINEGYDKIDDLRNAPIDELFDIGLKMPHARRIKTELSK